MAPTYSMVLPIGTQDLWDPLTYPSIKVAPLEPGDAVDGRKGLDGILEVDPNLRCRAHTHPDMWVYAYQCVHQAERMTR